MATLEGFPAAAWAGGGASGPAKNSLWRKAVEKEIYDGAFLRRRDRLVRGDLLRRSLDLHEG